MRRLIALLALLLIPAVTSAADFLCPQSALDLDNCVDPLVIITCAPVVDGIRTSDMQRIFRVVDVQEGPFLGVELTMTALTPTDDGRFAAARDELCVPPVVVAPVPPPVCPAAPASLRFGPAWYGPAGLVWYGP